MNPPATKGGTPRYKLALLTNIVAPYRVPIYNALARRFVLHLLLSGKEDNREMWEGTERQLQNVHLKRAAGFTIKYFAKRSRRASDDRYLHVNPGYVFDLIRLRPDAVVSVELGFRTLCAQLYCVLARVPLWIWWEGTLETEREIGGLRRALRRLLVRRSSWWISASGNATAYLRSLGVNAARIVQVQNCVDEQLFASFPGPPKALGPRPVLLVVSRLVPTKGIGLLLDAVAQLRAEGRAFTVVIVGDGAERTKLQRRARALGLANVEFHLTRAPEEMPAYYRGADMLVFPTLWDPWGLVVSEALWSGLPVLASKYAGCAAELLPTDHVFDPLDPKDFVVKLRRAIDAGLPPVDTSPLMPVQRVAEAIGDSIEGVVS